MKSLDELVRSFKLDDRMTLCHVWQTGDGVVAGFVEEPQHRALLKANGFDVSHVKLLPEESSTPDRFGFVTAEHAILRKLPKETPGDRDNASDLVRGETVWILDRKPDGWTLVHASDGYLGWVEASAILVQDAEEFRGDLRIGRYDPDLRGRVLEETKAGDPVENKALEVIWKAKSMLGTPYVWGGKTKDGIDCSGLTQTSFAKHGAMLPRDADQQSLVGRLVATRWFTDALLPGDLLFFISPKRGNVHHVAIYMGFGKYIEAGGGGRDGSKEGSVRIRSMKQGDADYDAERMATFAWARRVIE